MKKIFFYFFLFFVVCVVKAQTVEPIIKGYINGIEINYNSSNNVIHKGDIISFEAINKPSKKILEINGFTVQYFTTSTGSGKEQRDEKVFSKVFPKKDKPKNSKISISADELLKLHDFTKIEIELGKVYVVKENKRTEVPLHSSKRSFSFLLRQ